VVTLAELTLVVPLTLAVRTLMPLTSAVLTLAAFTLAVLVLEAATMAAVPMSTMMAAAMVVTTMVVAITVVTTMAVTTMVVVTMVEIGLASRPANGRTSWSTIGLVSSRIPHFMAITPSRTHLFMPLRRFMVRQGRRQAISDGNAGLKPIGAAPTGFGNRAEAEIDYCQPGKCVTMLASH